MSGIITVLHMYTKFIRPILFQFSPENAHWITFQMLNLLQSTPGALPLYQFLRGSCFKPVELMGLQFANRVGLAAGLDKNAELIPAWKALGFGFAEVGTVTPLAQAGNPKPRLFRLPADQALINRMGFNNKGLDVIVRHLKNRPKGYIVGGNVGKNTATTNENAVADYLQVFSGLYDYVDYLVVNVSCPNISNLSKLQDKEELAKILFAVTDYRNAQLVRKPVLLKVSPDLNFHQLDDSLQLVLDYGLDGVIATNTSVSRQGLITDNRVVLEMGNGGLSGRPIANRSTELVKYIRKYMPGGFPIIASGGVLNVNDAQQKLDAGADVLQLYTGFIYKGTGLLNAIVQM